MNWTDYLDFFKIPEISFTDILDILIVSYVIYRLFLLLKGTRAAKMATGIAFLVLFYFIAKIMGLKTIQWLLTTFVTYVVIAIIVLYQAELRRILANLGNTRLFRSFTAKDTRFNFDDIVLSAVTLSSKRIGALIVIERTMGLKGYTENGILLNATLSYDLLTTIFQPETALHDGAVIIQKRVILAASCFLPLTLEPHLSKEYGTRHRAAIGITEETDAVAVVVSEETGRISAAVEGKLIRLADADALQNFLRKELQPEEERRFISVLPWRRKEAKP
jgi:diadenylate cyclase